jgi:ABC-2 type transport system permease protein
VAFALAFNFIAQSATVHLEDPAWMLANYAGPDAFLAQAGKAYFPALFAWKAASSASLPGLGWAAANLGIGVLLAALAAICLGRAYAASLSLFGETRLKKIKGARGFIDRRLKRENSLWTHFLREFRAMNREPVYFLNGPFIVILMPAIIAVMLLAQRKNIADLVTKLQSLGDGPWLMLIAACAGAFLGSSTSITCTAVSRDAKVLPYLKSLPMSIREYVMAKFLHGFAFSLFGALVGSIGLGLPLGLGLPDMLGATFIALSISALIDIAGLWLDTVHPRLAWDNPTAALKQNTNSVVVILGTMGLLGGLGVLSALLRLDRLGFLLFYGLLPALLAGLAFALYPRYAERKLASLEC